MNKRASVLSEWMKAKQELNAHLDDLFGIAGLLRLNATEDSLAKYDRLSRNEALAHERYWSLLPSG